MINALNLSGAYGAGYIIGFILGVALLIIVIGAIGWLIYKLVKFLSKKKGYQTTINKNSSAKTINKDF
ncbi:hypothetical protein I6J18_09330 [Peribacillus psychrosaccharolyticus]|uniref:Uncharacterized protein n=1 Tax=Peribacillus psychrosaccharolyticus TaxID=1407 RepID=A0A974NQA3_PERPY|nr:hypothetical protein [Peribacillus psychrosaccharolyticus]MEC2055078.1 hypothetical protein [Peribacillus psychrosaccharolyticus]MED3743870.1 hypothetical protein [Peribacillus psychrosaccharolyticus]QQT02012.1 hypothetical protein I6J18_09330 [Peribacillus psychrosaccharolyticus]